MGAVLPFRHRLRRRHLPPQPQCTVPPTVGHLLSPPVGAGWPSVSEVGVGVTAHNTGVTGGLGLPPSVLEAKLRVHLPLEVKEEERACPHLFRERVTGSNSLIRRGSDGIHSRTNHGLRLEGRRNSYVLLGEDRLSEARARRGSLEASRIRFPPSRGIAWPLLGGHA